MMRNDVIVARKPPASEANLRTRPDHNNNVVFARLRLNSFRGGKDPLSSDFRSGKKIEAFAMRDMYAWTDGACICSPVA
jgi:hypothetical protein